MSATDWLVVGAAAAMIAGVNWYFFFAERQSKEGAPLRLVFDRQETSSCSEEVVIGDFGVRKFLPAFQKTVVELTPDHAGRFDFTCGMGMLHGTLVVER